MLSIADEIVKLNELRYSGALTDEEFAQAKARLLNAPARPERSPSSGPQAMVDGVLNSVGLGQETEFEVRAANYAMWLHLSLLCGYLLPLVGYAVPILLWQFKRVELPTIDEHGRNAMNFLLSQLVYLTAGGLLVFVGIGILIIPAVVICGIVFPVLIAMKAQQGEIAKYWLTIPFLK